MKRKGKSKRAIQYEENKAAKVGETIRCAVCGTEFTKKQYSQAFCCSVCKDKFWNDKGDRHGSCYYEEYDAKDKERSKRRFVYGRTRVVSVGGNLTPRQIDEVMETRSRLAHWYDTEDSPLDVESGMMY